MISQDGCGALIVPSVAAAPRFRDIATVMMVPSSSLAEYMRSRILDVRLKRMQQMGKDSKEPKM